MSGNGKKQPPLVADRRYGGASDRPKRAPAKGKSGASRSKGTARRRKTARQPAPPRGPIGYLAAGVRYVFRLIFRILWGFGWRMGLAVAILVGLGVAFYASTLPPVSDLTDARTRGSVTLLDRNGEVFAWRGDQFGGEVRAESVATDLHDAIVATEDRRFYRHIGIDPRGIASAVRINLREGRGPLEGHGGSTITQQTAKLLCLGRPFDPGTWENETAYEADCRRTTIWRKVQEAVYALALEARYTKEDILTIYMNRAYLGAGTRGVEAASQRYFSKSATELRAAQAAMLAGLLVAPSTYAPTSNLQRAQDRASVVLRLMEDQGYLTPEEAAEARANPATLSEAGRQSAGGYFADWVMAAGPDFFTNNTTEDVTILTTLDPALQRAAEEAMTYIFENHIKEGSEAQAAVVVMSADGAVRAMVGGRDVRATGAFNRASQALRQTGSAFKPFVYAAALEMNFNPLDVVEDAPFCMFVPGSGEYCPSNYSNSYRGNVTLTEALTHSLNIPAVKLSEAVGRELVAQVATGFGIESDIAKGPAMALGASEATLIEMTGAYAGILNGGSQVLPYGLVELRTGDEEAPLMEATGGIRERVIRQESAQRLTWMMKSVVDNGTGGRAALPGWEVAGKTGTSQAARDAWFIGFTADYVTGVWMGYDDNTPLTGVTGSGLPAQIWHETMMRVAEGTQPRPLPLLPPQGAGQRLEADSRNVEAAGEATERAIRDVLTNILSGQ